MAFSADYPGAASRVGAVFRLLMQLRLLLVGVTLLFLIGAPFTVSSGVAVASAAFCSWLGAHYWQQIMDRVLQHPLLLGLDVVVCLAILELGGPLGPFFLFTVVTSAVTGLLFRWPGVAYFCTLQILCYYAALTLAPVEGLWSFQVLLGQPAYYPLVGFVGIRVRRLLDEQAQMAEAQRQAGVEAAAADERARLARELHDSLAKTLRGIAMSATALPMWVRRSPERAAEEATRIASAAETASQEAREVVSTMRSGDVDRPPAALIRGIAEEWADRSGTAVRTDLGDDVELTVLGRYEAAAVLKEALTNVERHASAKHVDVALSRDGDHGLLEVRDDGCGFDAGGSTGGSGADGHYGSAGMRERAARADGTLTVDSVPGRGTTVSAAFPLVLASEAAETNGRGEQASADAKREQDTEAGARSAGASPEKP